MPAANIDLARPARSRRSISARPGTSQARRVAKVRRAAPPVTAPAGAAGG